MAKIGVALSGGGHRAAAFGLGVLLYLVDAGKNGDVNVISSVSGGSLTNAFVGLRGGIAQSSSVGFWNQMRPLAQRLASGGTMWSWWGTWVYLATLVAGLIGCLSVFACPWLGWHRVWVFPVLLIVWSQLLVQQRGRVCGWAFQAALFKVGKRSAKLADLANDHTDHVICATDLHAGEHVYFSGRFVCASRFGYGTPGDLPLHAATQASAAFPGGFPVRWLPTRRHEFHSPRETPVRSMALIDGGVYDNMGEQWLIGVPGRNIRWSKWDARFQVPDELVVVNASVNLAWRRQRSLRIPLVTELLTMMRVIGVLYDNTTAPRRKALFDRFERAARTGDGLRGALVTIEQTPDKVAKDFANRAIDEPARAARARAVLERLETECGDVDWDKEVGVSIRVPTTLRAMGTQTTARLIRHGYLTAMANLHTILDYPLVDRIPDQSRFETFFAG